MGKSFHVGHVSNLITACKKVIDRWEGGDLAGAVNDMREKVMVLDQCRPTQGQNRWKPKIVIVTEGGKVVQGFTQNQNFSQIEVLEASGTEYYERIKEVRQTMHPAQVRAWTLAKGE